jgi:hypothetical protein
VAGQLGYCGLDRRHAPLTGDELRGCWTGQAAMGRPPDSAPWASRVIDPASGGRRSRVDFVPIGESDGAMTGPDEGGTRGIATRGTIARQSRREGPAAADPATPGFRWVLWDDAES